MRFSVGLLAPGCTLHRVYVDEDLGWPTFQCFSKEFIFYSIIDGTLPAFFCMQTMHTLILVQW
jgi:hypothetical protein